MTVRDGPRADRGQGLTQRLAERGQRVLDVLRRAVHGPFTGVKDQVVGLYAERLAGARSATLAFDHRGFGESGGRRGHEDSGGKLADLRAAVDVLAAAPEVAVDRLGVVGICLGGGYAVRAAAQDPRLRAVVGIAGAYNSPAWFAERMGVGNYRSALRSFLDRYDETLPAVAPDGGEAAMGGAAPLLADTPLLIVHGKVDAYCSPDLAAAMHAGTAGDTRIAWLDATGHMDLYDREPYVTDAVRITAAFLHERLSTR